MQDKNHSKVKNILLALARHVGARGIRGLSAHLDLPESNLYSWIQRDKIGDFAAIIKKIPNARFEWLETGEGEMLGHSSVGAERPEVYGEQPVMRELSPDQEELIRLMQSKPDVLDLLKSYVQLDDEDERLIIRAEVKKALKEQKRREADHHLPPSLC